LKLSNLTKWSKRMISSWKWWRKLTRTSQLDGVFRKLKENLLQVETMPIWWPSIRTIWMRPWRKLSSKTRLPAWSSSRTWLTRRRESFKFNSIVRSFLTQEMPRDRMSSCVQHSLASMRKRRRSTKWRKKKRKCSRQRSRKRLQNEWNRRWTRPLWAASRSSRTTTRASIRKIRTRETRMRATRSSTITSWTTWRPSMCLTVMMNATCDKRESPRKKE